MSGVAPPTEDWPSHINTSSRKCPSGLPTEQSNGGIFLDCGSFFLNDCSLYQIDKNPNSTVTHKRVNVNNISL